MGIGDWGLIPNPHYFIHLNQINELKLKNEINKKLYFF